MAGLTLLYGGTTMALTRWNPSNETLFFGNEMDPIYEDNLARVLNQLPELEEQDWIFEQVEEDIRGKVLVLPVPA
jgi:hypothetical protein